MSLILFQPLIDAAATSGFIIDSISVSNAVPGTSITINTSNAAGALSITDFGGEGALVEDSSTANSITFTVPNPTTLGTKSINFNSLFSITVSDTSTTDTISFTINPPVGWDYDQIAEIDVDGIYADDIDVVVGDYVAGYVVSGDTGAVADLTTGLIAVNTTTTYTYAVYDVSLSQWSIFVQETFYVIDFTIPAKSNVQLSTVTESDPFEPSGHALDTAYAVSVEAGLEYAVSLDGGLTFGAYTSSGSNVTHITGQPTPQFVVRLTSSASFNTNTSLAFTFDGVSRDFSVTTRAAIVPTITVQPTDQNVSSGQTATFTLSANSAASYQWYLAPSTLLVGETSSSLSIVPDLSYDGNEYYCVVTSSDNQTVTSNAATLTVFAASITVTSDVMRDAITKNIRSSELNIPVVIRDASRNVLVSTTVSTDVNGIWSFTSNLLGDFGDKVYIEFYDSVSDTYTGFGYTLTT